MPEGPEGTLCNFKGYKYEHFPFVLKMDTPEILASLFSGINTVTSEDSEKTQNLGAGSVDCSSICYNPYHSYKTLLNKSGWSDAGNISRQQKSHWYSLSDTSWEMSNWMFWRQKGPFRENQPMTRPDELPMELWWRVLWLITLPPHRINNHQC